MHPFASLHNHQSKPFYATYTQRNTQLNAQKSAKNMQAVRCTITSQCVSDAISSSSNSHSSSAVVANLDGVMYISSQCASFGDCIAALGGPSVLLPLLQAASTPTQICTILKLVKEAVRQNMGNLKAMQMNGYKMLSFILSLKAKPLLDVSVVGALLDMCVSTVPMTTKAATPMSTLLVDSAAFYYLVINHQVR
jgi:hypothetical protein